MSNNRETFVISLKDKNFIRGLVAADRKTDQTKGKVAGLTGAVGHLRSALAGVSVLFLGREIVSTLSDFERFEAVLTNTLGSNSAAKKAMDNLVEFAANTPFSVDKLTDSYVKLANQGLIPTNKQMTNLGDLAASTGKDFDQLTEAIIDGQVGEFERLKEFGIRASKQGDKVKFTFKGVQTQVDFTEKAMQKYIIGLGDVAGVSGAMAAISKTTGGQISNLGDSVTQLYLNVGTKLKPAISGTIGVLSDMVEGAGNLVTWLASSSDGVDVLFSAIAGITGAFVTYGLIVRAQALYTGVLTSAQWLLNAAMTANPIGVVVVAVGALVAAFTVAYNTSDKFRGAIHGVWAALKMVWGFVVDYFQPAINVLSTIFTALKDSWIGAFNTIFGLVKKIITFVKPLFKALGSIGLGLGDDSELFGKLNKIKGAFNEAFDKQLDVKATEKEKEEGFVNTKGKSGVTSTVSSSSKVNNKGLSAGISEIKASAPKVFNINIGSLIKEQTIKTTNMNESAMKIKEAVTRVLLTAVNDAQVISE